MEKTTDLASIPEPTGYATHDTYFATRYVQGDRTFYSVDVSVPELIALIKNPDPEKPASDNRRITVSHAKSFADYILTREDWVCPPLLLRVPEHEFGFEVYRTVAGTDFGILSVPKLARHSLDITDGQHRVLGFHLGWERLDDELDKVRQHLARAKRNGDEPALVRGAETNLKRLLRVRDRLAHQRVGLNIIVVDDASDYRQVFVDIADNALGISRAVSVRFDRRKVVNRALETVLTHPLLADRVDEQSDRITKTTPFLMGAKHVADIIRAVTVGPSRRISKRQEAELSEIAVAGNACRFLDSLAAAFSDLRAIQVGELQPAELRARSLLGSATVLRVLAGVYGELVVVQKDTDENPLLTHDQATAFFHSLADTMEAPVTTDSPWFATGVFLEGAMAPRAGAGEVRKLTSIMISRAKAHAGIAEGSAAWKSAPAA